MQRIKVSAVTEAQQQALQLLEIENALKRAGIVLTDEDRQALGLKIAEIQKLTKEQEAAKTAAQQLKDVYTDIGMSIKSGIVDAIQSAVDGTKTLGEAAGGVLKNIANRLLDVAINMALFGAMSGTGTGGGLLGGLFKPRANGGPVTGGSTYLVGERGPELFVPGRSGSIVPNNQLAGGGDTNVVVNVDASGSKVEGNDQQGNQLGRVIAAAVQQELIKQKRPGGLLV